MPKKKWFEIHIDREKYKFTNILPYLIAFILPIFVMLVVFIQRGIWPFGDRCFLRTDLYHQYAPFFHELKYKLDNGGSLFYSWNIGCGTNFWALSSYYLADPFNLLIALFPENYVIEFVTLAILTKMGLCSVTLTYYLNKRSDKHGAEAYTAVFFGICYALSGYMAAYSWNVMWLDCLWLFPLVILGLERLVKENKGLLYCVTLGFSILTNFYISIMVCLGVAVYCFFLLGTERRMLKDFAEKFAKFMGYTFLAILFASIYLVPYFMHFDMTGSSTSTFTWKWTSYFSVFDMMSRQLMNVQPHTGLEHWPNIYCGMAIFIMIPFYYMNRKITLREKIGYTLVLIFFYFSFSTRAMDYIWHGFHIPNSLPCRQSFIYIFILLTMGYRGFSDLKNRSFKEIIFTMLGALAFVIAAEKLAISSETITNYVVYASAIFIVLYTILVYIYRKGKVFRDVLIVIMLALCCIENTINTSITSVSTVGRNDYTSFDDGVEDAMEIIEEREGDGFYRVEKLELRTKNDGAWLSYPSISNFSSTADRYLTSLYPKLGMESSFNAYGASGATYFTDMIFGVKYTIAKRELPDDPYGLYTLVSTNNNNVWVYENNYSLPLGYVLDSDALDDWDLFGSTAVVILNDLVNQVTGIEEFFEDVTPDYSSSKEVTCSVEEDGVYYIYAAKTGPSKINLTVNGYSRDWDNMSRGYLLNLGYMSAGDTFKLKNPDNDSTKNISFTLFRMKAEQIDEVHEIFNESPMIVDSWEDTKIEAHINVTTAGTLFTTIPYETGSFLKVGTATKSWKLKVDGVETDYYSFQNAFITLDLSEGEHTLEFTYQPAGFTVGLIITLLSALAMILIFILGKRREKRIKGAIDRAEQAEKDLFAAAEEFVKTHKIEAPAGDSESTASALHDREDYADDSIDDIAVSIPFDEKPDSSDEKPDSADEKQDEDLPEDEE